MPFPRLRPGVTYSSSSWSLGRKIGAVLAFVVGGVVAGASGIMLFAPETPGAFALAPPPAKEPVALTPHTVVAADTVEAPSAGKSDSLDRCQRNSAGTCDDGPKADPAAIAPDRNLAVALAPAAAPASDDRARPAAAASPTVASTPVASPADKSPAEATLPAIFMVPRAIASAAPVLASTVSAKTIPAMFLASRPIASMPHQLVSPALPALAASPKPVVTTAVALPAPKVAAPKVAEVPPATAPTTAAPTTAAKPRKVARTQTTNRRYASDNYYRQPRQNFFSFFFR
jgi:hypothetical protein